MKLTRRLRGFLGTMTTWGVAFSTVGVLVFGGNALAGVLPENMMNVGVFALIAVRGFVAGALSGGLFAALMVSSERNRTVSSLSTKRVALWGFLGAAAIPIVTVVASGLTHLPIAVLATSSLVAGAIGASIAAATVRIARRGELPAPNVDLIEG